MIVADANFVIALLNPTDAHHAWAKAAFDSIGGEAIGITALNLAETLVRPYTAGVGEQFEEALAELQIQVYGTAPEDATALAILRAGSGLRMPDVVALEIAIRSGAGLCTSDAKLAAVARQRGLRVLSPEAA